MVDLFGPSFCFGMLCCLILVKMRLGVDSYEFAGVVSGAYYYAVDEGAVLGSAEYESDEFISGGSQW